MSTQKVFGLDYLWSPEENFLIESRNVCVWIIYGFSCLFTLCPTFLLSVHIKSKTCLESTSVIVCSKTLPGLLEAVNNSWNFIQLWNTCKDDDDVSNSEWPRLRADCKFFCQPRSCDFVVAGILNCFGLLQTKILLALNFFSLR